MLERNYNKNWIGFDTPQNFCDYFSLIKVAKVYENGLCCVVERSQISYESE